MKKISVLLSALFLSLSFVANADEVYIEPMWNDKDSVRLFTVETPGFYRYSNERFSFTTYVPDCVKQSEFRTDDYGEAAGFVNADENIFFFVFGQHNIYHNSTKEHFIRAVINAGEIITYSICGDGWYIVSSVQNGRVSYHKGIVNHETVVLLDFDYPYAQKEKYDWMVPILERNFSFL